MKSKIEQIKKKIVPILREEGATKAALFGSVVRGEATKKSDVDILVEVPRGTGLFEFIGLKHKLEDALNKKVDLGTYNSIHPRLRDRILSEQIRIL